MKEISKILSMVLLVLPLLVSCNKNDEQIVSNSSTGSGNNSHTVFYGTDWGYHFSGDIEVYGEVIHREVDYILSFISDTSGIYLVDNGSGHSYTWQFTYTYDLSGNGTLYFIRPDNIPDYSFQLEQPYYYNPTVPSITFITGNDEWEAEHGRMVFLKKQINNNSN